jgi:phosphonoacetate hydrolase
LQNGVTFSAERADKCTKKEDGIDDCLAYVGKTLPNEYSADLSLFVLEAGVRIPGRESRI